MTNSSDDYELILQEKIRNFLIERYALNEKLTSFKLSDIKENFQTISPLLLEEACKVFKNENLISISNVKSRVIIYELNIELAKPLTIKFQKEIETHEIQEKNVKKRILKENINKENINKENKIPKILLSQSKISFPIISQPKKQQNIIKEDLIIQTPPSVEVYKEIIIPERKIPIRSNIDKVKSALVEISIEEINVDVIKAKVLNNELNEKEFYEILTYLSQENFIMVDDNMIYCI